MNGATATTSLSLDSLRQRLRRLNLFGLLAHAEQILAEPWLERVLHIEESERQQRSLKRRLANTRLGSFKPLADFDYGWPTELDRALLDELFTLSFLEQAANIVIVDKTVPFRNYREHAAFTWLLHALKVQDATVVLI